MGGDMTGKGQRFRDLHLRDGVFLMPNAWDPGTARILAAAGFEAIATTSAGTNYANGVTDYDYRVPRDAMLADFRRIAEAVEQPVSGDLEAGFGDAPEAVAETIARSVDCGMVGGSIEDHTGDRTAPLYDIELATDRIRAARQAADASGIAYTLTARAECYLVGHDDPFGESVRRLNHYRAAGADCLYAPGMTDKDTIAALVREVDGPINVVMGLAGAPLTVAELAAVGVKRVSTGGSLARAAFAVVSNAATEMLEHGSFGFAADAIPDATINALFASFRGDER